jgi:RHS repeat-associated protein
MIYRFCNFQKTTKTGNPMQTVYNQPNVALNYVNGGLDRYGRIVNHSWVKGNDPLVHIIHSYDYSGNRTKRYDAVHVANSELYTYDNLGQIKLLNRGTLNTNHSAVTTVNHSETWNFDKTGNWSQYTKNGTTENRTHNAANELQGIATHDANGNMVLMPGLKGKYDAWNRLVEVRDNSNNLIATYEYNALNQRIKKTIGSAVTKSFFNEQWQEIESQTGSDVTSYVWGLRYIDDLVLREKGEERLYSLADPNWNVIALVDVTGSIVERMKYDAFGGVVWLDAIFGVKLESNYAWNRIFTGQVMDSETGLMLYRNRYYNTVFGRFVSRDPIGYDADDINIYRYIFNRCGSRFDPYGFFQIERIFGNPSDYYGRQLPPVPPAQPTPPTPKPNSSSSDCPEGQILAPNPDKPPQANGCGPVNKTPRMVSLLNSLQMGLGASSLIFEKACDSHDLCYGNCVSSQGKCDDNFYLDMITECKKTFMSAPPTKYQNCTLLASIFTSAVKKGGGTAFGQARKKHCHCVPECKK